LITVGQPNKPPIVRKISRRAGRHIPETPMLTNPSQPTNIASDLNLHYPSRRRDKLASNFRGLRRLIYFT
jgi:hypothetical protein